MSTTHKSQASLNRSKTVQSQATPPQTVLKRSKTDNIKVYEDYIPLESEVTTASNTPLPTSSSTGLYEEDTRRSAHIAAFEEKSRSQVLEGKTKRSVCDQATWTDSQKDTISSQYTALLREMKDCRDQHDRETLQLKAEIQALQGEVRTLVRSAGQKLTVISCKLVRTNLPLQATQVSSLHVITHSQSSETATKKPTKLTQNQLGSSNSAQFSQSTARYCEAMMTLNEAKQSIQRTLAVSAAVRLRAEAN